MKQIFFWMILFCHRQLFSCAYDFVQYHIVDISRQEIYLRDDAHPYRELMMHLWVPVTEKQPCPLILFSHGLGDNFNGLTYMRLCQYCVSYGYVVASVSHTYACKNIQFLDGRMAPFLFPVPFHYNQPGKHMFDIETDWWLSDMICALDECVRQNCDETSLLYKKVDISRIGAMGHSLGGSVAIQAGRNDARVRAVINLDGPLYGKHAMIPVEKPLLMMVGSSVVASSPFSGGVPFHKEFIWRYYFNQQWLPALKTLAASSAQAQIVCIDKIVHGSFSDEALNVDPVIVPFVLSGEQAHAIIYAQVRDFFDMHL